MFLVLTLLFAVVAYADWVAALVLSVGSAALWFFVRHRGRGGVWTTIVGILAGVTAVGLIAALAVPTYHAGRDSLLVVSDNANSEAAVDTEGPNVSTISATGGLVNPDGSFHYVPAENALVHAHLGGARAQLVVQNYDPNLGPSGDFSPALASAALASPASQAVFAAAVASVVRSEGWDGVVIDFEQISNSDQAGVVDVVQLMTYDQNDPTSSPGPIDSTA